MKINKLYYFLLFSLSLLSCEEESFRRFELDKYEIWLPLNEEAKLNIAIFYPQAPKHYTVKWKSSNEDIVSIENGIIKAKAVGETDVSAQINDGPTQFCQVIVGGLRDDENDIYVAGSYLNRAAYWKNGNVTYLSNNDDGHASASSICVSGEDVYVAGSEHDNFAENVVNKYWKNGRETVLSDIKSELSDMAVSGNDVYIVGAEKTNDSYNQATYYSAIIWKNGIKTTLPSSSRYNFATSVFISGNDVYVAGYSLLDCAKYWKNGEEILLTDGIRSKANSITVVGEDVYVAGNVYDEQEKSIATYWINGVACQIPSERGETFANSIAVLGKDIYVSGFIDNKILNYRVPAYWKNGVETLLSQKNILGISCKIATLGNDVYFLANMWDYFYPFCWKNGVLVFFEKPEHFHGNDIVVLPKK